MAISLAGYLASGVPTIDGIPIGEAGVFDTRVKDFKYTPTKLECEYCARLFADTLPKGRLWESFSVLGTTNWAYSYSVGSMIAIMFAYVNYVRRELNPYTTVDLIDEWEESVGLPDTCTSQLNLLLDERRKNVVIRWRRTPIVLRQEMERACYTLTGLEVKVRPRVGVDKFSFDVFINFKDGTGLGAGVLDKQILDTSARYPRIIECVVNKLKPANSLAFFYYDYRLYEQQLRSAP